MDSFSRTQPRITETVANVDWESVYSSLLPKVFHYFAYRVGDSQTAEDLTSITFERAWGRRRRYRSDIGSFPNWVFGIARKVALEHYRNRPQSLPLEETGQQSINGQPETEFDGKQEFFRLAVLLAKLSDRERELVSLKYGAEMTNRAIAEVCELSESNVGTILHRVVKSLRSAWEVDDER